MDDAAEMLEQALHLDPQLARAHVFLGQAKKQEGRLDEAEQHLRQALRSFPRDKVVWNELGRVRYLRRRFAEAVIAFKQSLQIDPEDLNAHYNLMLCYRRLRKMNEAKIHEGYWRHFKPNESEDRLAGDYSRTHPEINNERQPIHDHTDDR